MTDHYDVFLSYARTDDDPDYTDPHKVVSATLIHRPDRRRIYGRPKRVAIASTGC
jgi:hypothetical protein